MSGPDADEEELRAKLWMRSVTRRAARVLSFLFVLVAVLLGGVQAALVHGPRPALLWAPLTFYAALAVWQARRRNWLLTLACLLAIAAYSRLFQQIADRGRALPYLPYSRGSA